MVGGPRHVFEDRADCVCGHPARDHGSRRGPCFARTGWQMDDVCGCDDYREIPLGETGSAEEAAGW